MKKIINNENRAVCSSCGGACCWRQPGAYVPEDLGLSISNSNEENIDILLTLLSKSSTREYDIPLYTIRSGIGRPEKMFSWQDDVDDSELAEADWCPNLVIMPFGEIHCIHLDTAKGCLLDWSSRPTMCKALQPAKKVWKGDFIISKSTADECEEYFKDYHCYSLISLRELSQMWEPYQVILNAVSRLRSFKRTVIRYMGKIHEMEFDQTVTNVLRMIEDPNWCHKMVELKRKSLVQKELARLRNLSNPMYIALMNAGLVE